MNPNIVSPADIEDYYISVEERSNLAPAMHWAHDVKKRFSGTDTASAGISLPWAKTHQDISLRPGEVSVWNGINGHGKSMLLGQVMSGCIAQGESVMIASMEMKPGATVARMCRQAAMNACPSPEFVNRFCEWAGFKLWLYDQQGTIKGHKLLTVAAYAADKLECKHVVIDSLMKCGMGEDDYNGQKHFVDELCSLARDWEIHIHLVTHSKKKEDENKPTGKMDVKGSGSITDQVDNVFTVWRNKLNENSMSPDPSAPDCLLICDKQRHGEVEAKYALWFDKDSQQYLNSRGDRPANITGEG